MSVHSVKVLSAKGAEVTRLFFKLTSDQEIRLIGTDLERCYEGALSQTFINADEDKGEGKEAESPLQTIRDILSGQDQSSHEHVFEIKATTPPNELLLTIKRRVSDNFLLRLCEITLTAKTDVPVATFVGDLLQNAIDERRDTERALRLESRKFEKERERSHELSMQILNIADERERVANDLIQRFLPILNAKKDRIKELSDRVNALEAEQADSRVQYATERGRKDSETGTDGNAKGQGESKSKKGTRSTRAKATETKSKTKREYIRTTDAEEEDMEEKNAPAEEAPTAMTRKKRKRVDDDDNNSKKVRVSSDALASDAPSESNIPLQRMSTRSSTRKSTGSQQKEETLPDSMPQLSSNSSGSRNAATTLTIPPGSNYDEWGPLPEGWEVATSRKTGARCYQNLKLKKKLMSRPNLDGTFTLIASLPPIPPLATNIPRATGEPNVSKQPSFKKDATDDVLQALLG